MVLIWGIWIFMDINGALYNTIRIDMKIYFMQRVLPILDRVKFFFIWNFVFFFYADDTVISLKKLIIQKLFTMWSFAQFA